MENADDYGAPRPPPDVGQEPSIPKTPHHECKRILDGLFDGHVSSKDAISSFITTGTPPKDGVAPLRDLFVALSALPTPDLERKHSSSSSSNNSSDATSNHANGNEEKGPKDQDNDHGHNGVVTSGSLASVPLPQPLSPTTTPQAALPPTPKPDDNTVGDGYDESRGQPDLKAFFIGLLASGKVSSEKVKQLFDISTLTAGTDFTALMEQVRQHMGYGFQNLYPYNHPQLAYDGISQGFQAPPSWNLQGPPQPQTQRQRQPTPHPQSFQQPPAHLHGLPKTHSSFDSTLAFDAGSYLPALSPGFDQQQVAINSFIPTVLPAHHPQPPPVNGGYNSVPLISSVPLDLSSHDLTVATNFERQNALPSPVVTQASSNTPEGSTTPNADPCEVICPLSTSDGNVCGKRCQGAKPYRSIQEHIRRAHPSRYMAGLPATEESFRAMVDPEGVACPMNKPDGSACDFRVTGSKPYRGMHEHVKEEHPDRFISGLPANEASFRIMVEKSECVVCPLEGNGGGVCNKRCFGEKRYRSIQEHIRRTHAKHYISGLHANEESFKKMTSGAASVTPSAPISSGTNIGVAPAPGNDFRRSSQGNVSLPASSSPITRSEEKSVVAAGINGSGPQPFTSHVWHPPAEETVSTVAPELLTMGDIQQPTYAQPIPPFFTYEFMQQQQQAFQTYASGYMQPQPQGLTGLLGSACHQDRDPTLTVDLFHRTQSIDQDPREYSTILDYGQAMQLNSDSIATFAPAPSINAQCAKLSSGKRKIDGPNGPNGDGKGRHAKKPSIRRGSEELCMGQLGSRLLETNGLDVSQMDNSHVAVPLMKKAASRAQTNQNGRSSPFFTAANNQDGVATGANTGPSLGPKTSNRPPRNTVSALPVPPLSADKFGLAQEDVAHDPFYLLVLTVFLTRTTGRAALPVFHEVKKMWPTSAELAAADPSEIKGLIHRLGLGSKKCESIQKLASTWTRQPPTKETRYGLKDYPYKGNGKDVTSGELFGPEDNQGDVIIIEPSQENDDSQNAVKTKARGNGTAWEIGHLTQGAYAIDSWRIFCRDVLLGRAEDWKGKGREATFQPEWMRVQPDDKELRAFLRWMWMKEGWWWDPRNGEKQVLSEKMRTAVDEGRVDYDNDGNLNITSAPRNEAVDGEMGAGTGTGFGAGFASG